MSVELYDEVTRWQNLTFGGWEGYVGTGALIGLIITSFAVFGIGLMIMVKQSAKYGIAFLIFGAGFAYFTWWQLFNILEAGGYLYIPIIIGIMALCIGAFKGWGAIAGAGVVFALTMLVFFTPSWWGWGWMFYPFSWWPPVI